MKILITAFEPFGGEKINTSAAVLDLLPDAIGIHAVYKLLLPVVFEKAAGIALAHAADCVFLLGEAGGRSAVTPELRARNVRNARIPDNEGNRPAGEPIRAGGPDTYETVFPVQALVDRMKTEGYEIDVSGDAGTYVCNDTFYLTGTASSCPVEFIHVPHRETGTGDLAATVKRFIELALTSRDTPCTRRA